MHRNKVILIAAALLLAGCSSLVSFGDKGPPPVLVTINTLDAPVPQGLSAPAIASIRIEEMEPAPELRSERIAVASSDVGVEYLAGARWVERPQVLLQRALIDAFASWGGLTALGSTNLDVPTDIRMTGRIDRYHLDVTAAPTVRLTVHVLLLRSRGGGIVASRRFDAEAPAAGTAPAAVARAFSAAQARMVTDIYSWAAQLKP